jgi:hypothetical protein
VQSGAIKGSLRLSGLASAESTLRWQSQPRGSLNVSEGGNDGGGPIGSRGPARARRSGPGPAAGVR